MNYEKVLLLPWNTVFTKILLDHETAEYHRRKSEFEKLELERKYKK